ncbi:hypothetical protein A9Q76_07310 [Arcobacter sp. 31_11_sub10_T18]|nr:hypothetical protein A9Q76_07310 [Arcobacter sp. 31_11_sub10_T18]
MKKTILFFTLFLLQTLLFAQTSVWKIQHNNETIYLGGTVHLLRAQDYPLPIEYEKAYENSNSIYFETDLQTLESQAMQKNIIDSLLYKNGKKLSNILSPSVYKALNEHAKSRGINLLQFDNFKPAMILLSLTVLELQTMGITSQGVDKFYLTKSLKDSKHIGKLESVQTHINYIASMGKGNENNLILQSLKDFKETKKKFKQMLQAWRDGENQTIYKLFVADMKKYTPKLYKSILVERNNNWMPVLKSLFKNNKTEFVLVGTAHLVGKDGLLQQLKSQGYKVERFK